MLPYIVDLDYFPFLPGLLPGGRALHRRTLEVSPHAAGVREYAPGDPLSRIHWKSTARRDHIMVKEFEQDPQADVWILLDAHRHSHIREKQSKRQQPVEQFWFWTHKSEVYWRRIPTNTLSAHAHRLQITTYAPTGQLDL